MKFIAHDWKWAHGLVARNGAPPKVVWHHAAAKSLTPARLNALHKSLGWTGIGYHVYITKTGRVHRGRPFWAMGGHCLTHNDCIGVCLEGNYDVEKNMPAKQLRAAQEVHDFLEKRYPAAEHRKHGSMSGNATACPGRFFPFKAILAGVPEKDGAIRLTDRSLTLPRTTGVKAGWCTVGFRPWLKRVEDEHPKRATIGPNTIVIPVPETLPWWWDEMLAWRKSRNVIIATRTRKQPISFWRHKR